ncbi:hypothetical protein RFI_02205 [Reticulomyxa filosa]|uniref:Uncharacterized protein n=1 Tax=Reticulomyxa filosa TaxID=46433 RepID=X6PB71_RETFI|nr:hypothetical protein RFI_02205 [Reticulomyxa filosa]|eukprot:ETO34882.1 hypothetical protein RFI_02205 [Reticulomyxa filosa]
MYDRVSYRTPTYYFVLTSTNSAFLQISLTSLWDSSYLALNAYISNNETQPNSENAQWRILDIDTHNINGTNMLVITPDDPHYVPNTFVYYIGVHAESKQNGNSRGELQYQIFATSNRIILTEGYPLVCLLFFVCIHIHINVWLANVDIENVVCYLINYFAEGIYYSFDVVNNDANQVKNTSLEINVVSNYVEDVFTVVVTNTELTDVTACTASNHCPSVQCDTSKTCSKFQATRGMPVRVQPSDLVYCHRHANTICTYLISVFLNEYSSPISHEHSDVIEMTTTVSSSSETATVIVFEGGDVYGDFTPTLHSDDSYYDYYQTHIAKGIDHVQVSVDLCYAYDLDSGHSLFTEAVSNSLYVMLYLSETHYYPDQTNYQVQVADKSIINYDGVPKDRTYYFGVTWFCVCAIHFEMKEQGNGCDVVTEEPIPGSIIVTSMKKGKATVNWERATIKSIYQSDVKIEKYVLYFARADDSPFNMERVCGLEGLLTWNECTHQSTTSRSCYINLNATNSKQNITGLEPSAKYTFNIVVYARVKVQLSNTTNYETKSVAVPYNAYSVIISNFDSNVDTDTTTTRISKHTDTTQELPGWIIFGIVIGAFAVIAICVVAIVLFVRTKQLEKEMKALETLHMEDVPLSAIQKSLRGKGVTDSDNESSVGEKKENVKEKQVGLQNPKKYHQLISMSCTLSFDIFFDQSIFACTYNIVFSNPLFYGENVAICACFIQISNNNFISLF